MVIIRWLLASENVDDATRHVRRRQVLTLMARSASSEVLFGLGAALAGNPPAAKRHNSARGREHQEESEEPRLGDQLQPQAYVEPVSRRAPLRLVRLVVHVNLRTRLQVCHADRRISQLAAEGAAVPGLEIVDDDRLSPGADALCVSCRLADDDTPRRLGAVAKLAILREVDNLPVAQAGRYQGTGGGDQNGIIRGAVEDPGIEQPAELHIAISPSVASAQDGGSPALALFPWIP